MLLVTLKLLSSDLNFSFIKSNVDSENGFELFVGTEKGALYHYNTIDDNLNGSFEIVSDYMQLFSKSIKTAPAIYDLNNDGWLDFAGFTTGSPGVFWEAQGYSTGGKNIPRGQADVVLINMQGKGFKELTYSDLIKLN